MDTNYLFEADDIFLDDSLEQYCVYWHPLPVGDEGQKTFATPIEIRCRWESISEDFLDHKTGNESQCRSKIFCDRDLKELGVLWIPQDMPSQMEPGSAIVRICDQVNPLANEGAFEIRSFNKIPTYDGDEFVRIAYL